MKKKSDPHRAPHRARPPSSPLEEAHPQQSEDSKERKRDDAQAARSLQDMWAEGARLQACLNMPKACSTPDECLMVGCARIAWGELVQQYVRQAKTSLR